MIQESLHHKNATTAIKVVLTQPPPQLLPSLYNQATSKNTAIKTDYDDTAACESWIENNPTVMIGHKYTDTDTTTAAMIPPPQLLW